MSKEEIKYEINKELDNFSDKALQDLLEFLRQLNSNTPTLINSKELSTILSEDKELLEKLAK